MEDLKSLLNQGIKFEDEFIELYFKVIKDEGFIEFFPDQEKAKQLLQKLITESQSHKAALETIINKL